MVGSDEEGLFLAGLVSSAPARYFVLSYTVSTQISTHVLEHVAIPTYVPTVDPAHAGMVAASNRARGACARGDSLALAAAEAELDEHARVLWGLSLAELTVGRIDNVVWLLPRYVSRSGNAIDIGRVRRWSDASFLLNSRAIQISQPLA